MKERGSFSIYKTKQNAEMYNEIIAIRNKYLHKDYLENIPIERLTAKYQLTKTGIYTVLKKMGVKFTYRTKSNNIYEKRNRMIFLEYEHGVKPIELASIYNLSYRHVLNIINRQPQE